ncbi:hypothetical protein GWI33_001774 [Rhynchophorus ferrugineus]|uniref:Uncharacterized protein n=1 Tax=Rhynchophorus ferrugineus TaxID=354439 RepID=A0A834IL13_RHYFE|nr:hypothetical protein GWI33_001774 [Rhynchophorus ferrugineus]
MIMMDVSSMYGHASQHGSSSYNPDSSYYNYNNSAPDLPNHPLGGNHPQYGSGNGAATGYSTTGYHTASPFEDNTYLYGVGGASTDSGVDTPPSPQDLNYYSHQGGHQETSIINTETGLSYTNLDYANANSPSLYHHHQQPGYSDPSYAPRVPHDLLLRHHDETGDPNPYLHDTKYHGHQLDHAETPFHHHPHIIATPANTSCMEYQHLSSRYKDDMMGDGRLRQHTGMHTMVPGQPQQPVIPTYKWMQVKRNVPKPAVPICPSRDEKGRDRQSQYLKSSDK